MAEYLICNSLLEVARAQLAIHALNAKVAGRGFPYVTPLRAEDRIGPDDGSTVEVKRHVRAVRLADGTFGIPISPKVRALLESGRLGEVTELTATQRTRVAAIWAARRAVADAEIPEQSEDIG